MQILNNYLISNNISVKNFKMKSGMSESKFRTLNNKPLLQWNLKYIDLIANTLNIERKFVIQELEEIEKKYSYVNNIGRYNLENRRYIGSKNKLMHWIKNLISTHTNGNTFFDVFAGTGIVSKSMLDSYEKLIINDFLFSNEIIYEAFFSNKYYDRNKLVQLMDEYKGINSRYYDDTYFEDNYGGKFFSKKDAEIIGEIRERIEINENLNNKEKSILTASLIYSADKCANTVGHYDAYRKKNDLENKFSFELINPIDTSDKEIEIFREDSNSLVKKVKSDVAFIDPPYNSRQYSRFYHVLEGIAKWNKPELSGVAMKPPAENMSEYCKVSAAVVFEDLIQNINTRYIAVIYNNTYNSKSSSSKNKISHEQILNILNKKGQTQIFETNYKFFNSGKTDFTDHKEYLFITEVKDIHES